MLLSVPFVIDKYIISFKSIMKYLYYIIISPLLFVIQLLIKYDKKSQELHSGGIHVHAKKNNPS